MHDLEQYRYDSSVFITYTDVAKLGINPRPIDTTTPMGIYAYRLTRVWEQAHARSLPFSYRRFVYVFEARDFLNLGTYTEAQYDDDVGVLIEHYSRLPQFLDPQDMNDFVIRNERSAPAESIWNVTRALAKKISIMSNRPQGIVWNAIWRTLGYTGVYDPGLSLIHPLEPSQAVFFTKEACHIVELIEQKDNYE